MSVPTAVLFFLFVVGVVALTWAVARWIPACVHSVFRYRLWEIHDDLVDLCLDGRLPSAHPAVEDLRLVVQRGILLAPRLTMGRWIISGVLSGGPHVELPSRDGLTHEQVDLLDEMQHSLGEAYLRHLAFSSPGGWAVLAATPVLGPILTLRNRLKGRNLSVLNYVEDKVVETVPRPDLAGVSTAADLSHCV